MKARTSAHYPQEFLDLLLKASRESVSFLVDERRKAVQFRQEVYNLRRKLENENSPIVASMCSIVIRLSTEDGRVSTPADGGTTRVTLEPRFSSFIKLMKEQEVLEPASPPENPAPSAQSAPSAPSALDNFTKS